MDMLDLDLPDDETIEKPRYEPPADGKRTLQIVDTGKDEYTGKKDNKVRKYVWFDVQIMDDDMSPKRTFRHMCVYDGPDPKEIQRGLYALKMICKAVGLSGYNEFKNSDQVENIPFTAEIKSKPQKSNPEYFNTNISNWLIDGEDQPSSGKSRPHAAGGETSDDSLGWKEKARQRAAEEAAAEAAGGGGETSNDMDDDIPF